MSEKIRYEVQQDNANCYRVIRTGPDGGPTMNWIDRIENEKVRFVVYSILCAVTILCLWAWGWTQ